MEKITVITTGGTVDKIYGSGIGVRDMEIGMPVAEDILLSMGLEASVHFIFVEVVRKDSLDMDDDDRARIVAACVNSESSKIIITHGTDSMIKTARALEQSGLEVLKSIVLTGALQPASMKQTDAEFNLGMALAICLTQNTGIMIAMNGIHEWDHCIKDEHTGKFIPIQESVH